MATRTVAEIFTERAALETYLRVEATLASAQADLDIVPREAADAVSRRASLETLDLERLRIQTSKTGYPIAPLVRQLAEACGEDGRWVHWGATTQDILNTALALQVNESWERFGALTARIVERMVVLVDAHRNTLMVARTFGGHALPITFGFKLAVWLSGILRHAERIRALQQTPMEGEFAGVAGTLASLDRRGLAVRKRLMERLGLTEPRITWGSMRDCVYERASILAGLTGTLAKIAQDIAELASTEIGELAEPPTGGKDASSTLPFKSNPILCARAAANATLVAQLTGTVLQAGRQREERSGEGLLEYEALPRLFVYAEKCVEEALLILQGLQVFPSRMRANLELTHGVLLSERYMMALAPYLGRLQAHDLVHEACRETLEQKRSLADVLYQMPEVSRHFDAAELQALADPRDYLGTAGLMMDAVLDAVKQFSHKGIPTTEQ